MLLSLKKSILLSIVILFFTACADKTNGKYYTKYSYHPYYSLYSKKMSNAAPKQQPVKYKSKKKEKATKISTNTKSRFPDYSVKK